MIRQPDLRSFSIAPALAPAIVLALALALVPGPGSAADAPGEVRGLVLDAEDAPVEGVAVSLLTIPSQWETLRDAWELLGEGALPDEGELLDEGVLPDERDIEAWAAGRHESRTVGSTTTDEAGRFRLPLPRPDLWRVRVDAEGSLPFVAGIDPSLPVAELPPLRLAPVESVEVRVVDERGRPVAGALVAAVVFLAPLDTWHPPLPFLDVTDAEGRARVRQLRADNRPAQLVAQARRPLPDGSWQVTPAAQISQGDATLRFDDTEPVELRIERSGRPLAGVLVTDLFAPLAAADEDGMVRVRPSGGSSDQLDRLHVVAPDGRAAWTPGEAIVDVPADFQARGRVVGSQGHGIADAVVWVPDSPPIGGDASTRTARDGYFELSVPSWPGGGLPMLSATATGYRPAEREARSEADLVLHRAAELDVRIVDGDGAPVPTARVQMRSQGAGFDPFGTFLRPFGVDEEGHCRITGLKPRKAHHAVVSAPGFADLRQTVSTGGAGEAAESLVWTLTPSLVLTGRVVDGERGVAEAVVHLEPRADPQHGPLPTTQPLRRTTGADGTFRFDDAAPVTYQLGVSAESRGSVRRVVELAGVVGRRDLGDLPLDRDSVLRGRVVDGAGEPVAGIRVTVHAPRSSLSQGAIADAEGRFSIAGVPDDEGSVNVSAFGEHHAQAESLRLAAPWPEEVEVVVHRNTRVAGRVLDAEGRPASHARIAYRIVQPGGSTSRSTSADGEGRFDLQRIRPGPAHLVASADGQGMAELRLEVETGETVEGLELVLQPGMEVAGRVVDADGEPVAAAAVEAYGRLESFFHAARDHSDASGAFRLQHLGPGAYRLVVTTEDHPTHSEPVEVRQGESLEGVEIRLPRTRAVHGVVVDENGEPRTGVTVELGHPGRPLTTHTDAAGRFAFEQPPSNESLRLAVRRNPGPDLELWRDQIPPSEIRLVVPHPTAELHGRIFGLDDVELQLVTVRISGSFERSDGHAIWTEEVRPRADGTFHVEGLFRGRWNLSAELGDRSRDARVEIGDSSVADVELDFGEGFEVRGRVHLDGEPLTDANLRLQQAATGTWLSAQADSLGRFRLDGVEPGAWRVEISRHRSLDHEFRHQETVQIQPGTELVFDLRSATLRGRLAANGHPPGRQALGLHQGDAYLHFATRADGSFELHTGLVGPAHLHLASHPERPKIHELDLVPGLVTDVGVIEMPAPAAETP